eukprot:403338437
MSANLSSERDIAKFFSLSGVTVRPDACQAIIQVLHKLTYFDHKRAYLEKFLKHIKDRQIIGLNTEGQGLNNSNGAMLLDRETALTILQQMPISESDNYLAESNNKTSNQSYGSFKDMKKMQALKNQDTEMKNETGDISQIQVKRINPLMQDKVYKSLLESVVILEDFTQFPQLIVQNNQLYYSLTLKRTLSEVNISRQDYYNYRLQLAEDRVFSHTDKYVRPKLEDDKSRSDSSLTKVCNISSIMGSNQAKWVLGILTMHEDSEYYLEDQHQTVKVSFSELEFADPEVFFTENSILMCCGIYHNETYFLTQIRQPPLHAQKSLQFKVNERDYFGAYSKKKMMLAKQQVDPTFALSELTINNTSKTRPDAQKREKPDDCIVILSQLELDSVNTQKNLPQLLEGLESMKADIIVLVGNFISQKLSEKLSYDQFKTYFESIGQVVRENNLTFLRDSTQWIFIPSVDDPGQPKLMPCLQFQEYFLTGFKGNGPQRIKNVILGTNPMRISYYGKEIVISRYNFFKKLKRNQIPKIQIAQEKTRTQNNQSTSYNSDDSFKIAKTVLHQGTLIPVPSIVQPIMWSFSDALQLVPHPDFLILCDEITDYHHQIEVPKSSKTSQGYEIQYFEDEEGQNDKFVHVVNPGNFSINKSFVTIYPLCKENFVQQCQL